MLTFNMNSTVKRKEGLAFIWHLVSKQDEALQCSFLEGPCCAGEVRSQTMSEEVRGLLVWQHFRLQQCSQSVRMSC